MRNTTATTKTNGITTRGISSARAEVDILLPQMGRECRGRIPRTRNPEVNRLTPRAKIHVMATLQRAQAAQVQLTRRTHMINETAVAQSL